MTLKPGAWVDPAKMTRAIKDSGFTPVPEEVRLIVAGTIEKKGDGWLLRLSGMKEPRDLTLIAPPDGEAATALTAHAGKPVTVTGRWRPDGSDLLEVEAIDP